jgi:hypothetical protein
MPTNTRLDDLLGLEGRVVKGTVPESPDSRRSLANSVRTRTIVTSGYFTFSFSLSTKTAQFIKERP